MTFAAITPALIVGAFAERMKFSAVALFIPLWVTLVYFPIAHMVWYWAGPDAIDAAAKARAPQPMRPPRLPRRPSSMSHWPTPAGLQVGRDRLRRRHRGAHQCRHRRPGRRALIGKRIGYGKEPMAPHSLTLTMVGASLLWVGWFGFNAGSNLEANGGAALAMINTFVATAAAAMSWMFAEWMVNGKPSLLGAVSGCVAGLVAVTPAAGYSGPMGAIVLGLVVGVVCLFFCHRGQERARLRRCLDVFGVHCVGGIVGALGTGILVNPALGGAGIMDYTTGKIADYELTAQMIAQAKACSTTLVWSGVGSVILYKVVDVLVGPASIGRDRNAKASTSPSTVSAPTTCKFSRDAITWSRPELRFGHIPGNAPTVEGLQRKLEPLSFRGIDGPDKPGAIDG